MGLSGTQEQPAWQNSPPHNIFTTHRVSDWSDVVEEVLRGQSKHNTKLFFTLAWIIWGNRNNVWLQKSGVEADKMCEKAVDYMEEYKDVTKKVAASSSIMVHRWIPPYASRVKMKVVWRNFKPRKSVGVGVMVQNHMGELMAGYSEDSKS